MLTFTPPMFTPRPSRGRTVWPAGKVLSPASGVTVGRSRGEWDALFELDLAQQQQQQQQKQQQQQRRQQRQQETQAESWKVKMIAFV
jgi:hypothetical protein